MVKLTKRERESKFTLKSLIRLVHVLLNMNFGANLLALSNKLDNVNILEIIVND